MNPVQVKRTTQVCHSTKHLFLARKTGLIAYFPTRFLSPHVITNFPQLSPSFSNLFSCWLLVGRKCLEQKDKALIKNDQIPPACRMTLVTAELPGSDPGAPWCTPHPPGLTCVQPTAKTSHFPSPFHLP